MPVSRRSLYRKIAEELRMEIVTGGLPPGSRLPTEEQLVDRYRVSRNTVRLALGVLVNEGIITSMAGRGTFVRERIAYTFHAHRAERMRDSVGGAFDAFWDDVRGQGREPGESLEVQVVSAQPTIAGRLGIAAGEPLALRRIVRSVDGRAWSLQSSYYPMELARTCGLLAPENIERGVIRVMAEHGHREVSCHDEITGRMPSPEESLILDIDTGVPVIVHSRAASSVSQVVRLSETIFPTDRNRIVYELSLGPAGED